MQVFRGIPERATQSCVLTIGNFDGVHLGHQALLAELRAVARRVALPAAVLTFEPHPREFFAPESAPARLTSLREKMLLLDGQGVDHLYICRFNARFAGLSAEDFVEGVLAHGLSTRHLIIGDDFRYGKGRRGDFAQLQQAGAEHRFVVEAMRTVMVGEERASSSAIRRLLAQGDMAHAARLLGRPYSIAGRVVHGNKLGRKLGFPTANIQLKRIRLALAGIFAVTVEGIDAQPLPGVASLGLRPTVEGDGRFHLEVHLFDFDRELYDAHLRVNFLHKLRDEAKYDSLDALTAQISRDCAQARNFLSQLS
ncbi:MAG TPA: bifunctional riboflavin kinase/FAD synthetase [Rhodocyclaceae bacterium]|nr:bifunctional riboflavin kinase/FAD synthetase [Rhodocyclaceae bacterium]HMV52292.1 bifunctional riboflavin kinase/FAD synthetase [Rhodocyclaceae bacterium]HMZ83593.1 bifunctional riboflavin kinase/FAD synthetase [Rhodocyclaceae bacterium]HNB78374.1 bifunctional riboflavin kinase/FAD synthetase [Rhodocyclaceae bacterium]HNC62745.1 bifunctional riboflavin kinase/FAD synthetase [Rhodocyclaceae bacterium]